MTDRRLRVVMFLGGFPSASRPHRAPFNLRAAKLLRNVVDLTVCVLRAWIPGRPLRETYEVEGIPVVALSAPQLPRFTNVNMAVFGWFAWPLARTLLRDADVVHSVDAARIGMVAGRWARRAGLRHVTQVTQDMTVVGHLRNAGRGWGGDFDAVACNSAAVAEGFRSRWPDVPNVHVVHRGVDLNLYNPAGEAAPRPAANTRFAYFGGFPTYATRRYGANTKGGYVLLEAWKSAEEEMRAADARLVIAGPECDREEVVAWHRSLREPERVEIAGILEPSAIPRALRSVDAVIVPSLHEGLPNIAVEASASARPVIGSSIPPMREVVANGETGMLVPAGDAAALSDALLTAARDPELLRRHGRAARAKMEREFDHDQYAVKMLAIYRSVASLGAR